MKYVFDIDGTICDKNKNDDYDKSYPFLERIRKINKLYDDGHYIVFFTARGMGRHNNNAALAIRDFYSLTEKQLSNWNVKHHQLILGKPSGDLYIDDKGIKDGDFFTNELRS
jgi:hydroxymethylpyrimidine pyrophosphatase-like HAD family hydrolase